MGQGRRNVRALRAGDRRTVRRHAGTDYARPRHAPVPMGRVILTPPSMARRLFNFLTVASLLLCVAVCALWARSYWTSDWLFRQFLSDDGDWTHWTQDLLL